MLWNFMLVNELNSVRGGDAVANSIDEASKFVAQSSAPGERIAACQ